ncbi:MAG TPA: hypothetical protein VFE37_00055 [Chloroflexota bacterium]|nr:hypothetical protein [Chloroflexota bacterium]
MRSQTNGLLLRAAQALYGVLGAPPFTARAPVVVLVSPSSRSARDRATVYRQRYSRYLAATGGDERR